MKGIVNKLSATGKTALVMIQKGKSSLNNIPVYVRNDNFTPKQEIDLGDVKIVPWANHFTSEANGKVQLMTVEEA